ncbi:unnamed protein product [Protopolystoma xenopodis]|uniref:Uncharacterized protein n=1 Tax=Protopolystoma xenopodis TaxID=117903 RepID=A0A3S5CPH2_9PLAT|nr:unnamed protein product [Protopolystoma xenopodis]
MQFRNASRKRHQHDCCSRPTAPVANSAGIRILDGEILLDCRRVSSLFVGPFLSSFGPVSTSTRNQFSRSFAYVHVRVPFCAHFPYPQRTEPAIWPCGKHVPLCQSSLTGRVRPEFASTTFVSRSGSSQPWAPLQPGSATDPGASEISG